MAITDKPVVVGTTYDCVRNDDFGVMSYNPSWRHNMIGCILISILKDMYNLKINYTIESPHTFYSNKSSDVDFYAVPLALSPQVLKFGYPIQAVVHARYGFLVRRPQDIRVWNRYYTKPFSLHLWEILFLIALLVCCLFGLTAWWERRLLGGVVEYSLGLEMLLIIGGYCQHIPPVEAILSSRRAAYFTFFLYSYIIYTVYTSNLLSHLVSDKENDIGLEYLEAHYFEFAVLDNMKHILSNDYIDNSDSAIYNRLSQSETLRLSPALDALRWNRTALLSDYKTLYPRIRVEFSDVEICELVEVDLIPDVRKYIFASTRFAYKENLKIGILRAKEAGILDKFSFDNYYRPLSCDSGPGQLEVKLGQISVPLMILVTTYAISVIIMLLERLHILVLKRMTDT